MRLRIMKVLHRLSILTRELLLLFMLLSSARKLTCPYLPSQLLGIEGSWRGTCWYPEVSLSPC